ncbi:MAG: hypothetical protein CDV28_10664 [Candidatus Electronema aureum]|uniref:Uncharacterized protein n=1 Tax=Candidatus Electronema aureum TaxID=2005002 RepID=A0A521G3A0_9BACT|nr:MAG: hypothetical protein CDV28_10664 [Candidatus Electronema aureum]
MNNDMLQKNFKGGDAVEVYANPAAYTLLEMDKKVSNEMTWIKGRYVSKVGTKQHCVDISPGYSDTFSDECIRPFETSLTEQKIALSSELNFIKMEFNSFINSFAARQRARGRSPKPETEVEKDITNLAKITLKLVQYIEKSQGKSDAKS